MVATTAKHEVLRTETFITRLLFNLSRTGCCGGVDGKIPVNCGCACVVVLVKTSNTNTGRKGVIDKGCQNQCVCRESKCPVRHREQPLRTWFGWPTKRVIGSHSPDCTFWINPPRDENVLLKLVVPCSTAMTFIQRILDHPEPSQHCPSDKRTQKLGYKTTMPKDHYGLCYFSIGLSIAL